MFPDFSNVDYKSLLTIKQKRDEAFSEVAARINNSTDDEQKSEVFKDIADYNRVLNELKAIEKLTDPRQMASRLYQQITVCEDNIKDLQQKQEALPEDDLPSEQRKQLLLDEGIETLILRELRWKLAVACYSEMLDVYKMNPGTSLHIPKKMKQIIIAIAILSPLSIAVKTAFDSSFDWSRVWEETKAPLAMIFVYALILAIVFGGAYLNAAMKQKRFFRLLATDWKPDFLDHFADFWTKLDKLPFWATTLGMIAMVAACFLFMPPGGAGFIGFWVFVIWLQEAWKQLKIRDYVRENPPAMFTKLTLPEAWGHVATVLRRSRKGLDRWRIIEEDDQGGTIIAGLTFTEDISNEGAKLRPLGRYIELQASFLPRTDGTEVILKYEVNSVLSKAEAHKIIIDMTDVIRQNLGAEHKPKEITQV
jgi:hypothetical protein